MIGISKMYLFAGHILWHLILKIRSHEHNDIKNILQRRKGSILFPASLITINGKGWQVPSHLLQQTRYTKNTAYMKWVVNIMVLPALCFSNKSHVPLRAYGSIPEVGSSKNTISDPPMRAIAQLWIRTLEYAYYSTCNISEKILVSVCN